MSEDRKTQYVFGGAMRRVMSNVDGEIRCLGCMETYPEEYELCPMCGYVENAEVENALHLYPGTVLNGKYIVGKVLGCGGFGVTYLAWDTVLQTKVAIKEYIPSEFSTRSAGQTRVTIFSGEKNSKQFLNGKEKFIEESKHLAVFRGEPGIVEIYDTFEENETAYLVMEYLDGETLKDKLEREGKIEPKKAIEMLMPVMSSLDKVHEAGIIHRDIAPDNIFLTKNGEVKLIDFGASRYAATSRSKSLTVIIKQGYSAEEQYRSNGDQGTHTDIYSLGAVLYKMITGVTPPDAMERGAQYEKTKKDMLIPINKLTKEISKNQATAIYNAMNVRIADRTSNIVTFAGELQSDNVKRRKIGIKKLDPLTWPLWAKIGLPVVIIVMIILMILLSLGIIGPKLSLQKDYIVPDGQTLIPDVIGKSIDNAETLLIESNLIYTIKDKVESSIPKETVMLQNPDAFNITDMGTAIELILSDGNGTEYVVDVTGKTIEEATTILEDLGFKVKTKEEAHKEVAPGSVVSQSIAAGEEAEKGSEITLVVSTGSEDIDTEEMVNVPDLIGKNYNEAIDILTENNLYYSKEEVYDSSKPENQVIRTNPEAGEEVNAGTEIKITVNMGAKTIVLKNYSYRNLESAKAELENQGIVVNVKYEENKYISKGTIISSRPGSGTTIKVGSTVVLTVSKGYTVTVPDVRGMKLDAAQSKLTSSGLASSITRSPSETVAEGKIISQSVAANTKVAQGTLVVLVVSSGPSEKTPDPKPVPVQLTSLTITSNPKKSTYYVGDAFDKSGLVVTAKYSDGTTRNVTNQASIKAPDMSTSGTKTVTVSYENKTASFTITVNSIKIWLSTTSLSIKVGDTSKIIPTTTPAGCAVTWSINDTSIATVSNDGTVTAKKTGNATITATIKRGSETKSITCSVKVTTNTSSTQNWLENMSIPLPDLNLKVGEVAYARAIAQSQLWFSISNMEITWSSSNTSVVTVTGNDGKMTAIAPGESIITAIANVQGVGKVKFTGTVRVTQSATQSSGYTVTFNANGGYVSQKNKTVTTGASYGSLPTPTRNGFTFIGWFKEDGSQVANKTIFNDSKNITLKAHWKSGWVEESKVPAGSQIAEQKWTYTSTKTTSSSSPMMAGWTFSHKENGYGKEIGPVYKDPTDTAGKRKVRSEQYVSSETTYYKYYHQLWGNGGKHEISLTQQLGQNARYKCPQCGQSNVWWVSAGQDTTQTYATRWYYQEPETVYYFKKVENLESTKEVTASETISNVKKWVKYIIK